MKFRVNLNAFTLVTKETPKWPGKKVRFNVVWWLEQEDGTRLYWLEMKGCLARLSENGDLKWTPPQAGIKGFKYQVIEVNDTLYNEIKKKLVESKWFGILKNTQADLTLLNEANNGGV